MSWFRNPSLRSSITPLSPLSSIYFTAANDACEQRDAVAVFHALMRWNDMAKYLLPVLLILHGTGTPHRQLNCWATFIHVLDAASQRCCAAWERRLYHRHCTVNRQPRQWRCLTVVFKFLFSIYDIIFCFFFIFWTQIRQTWWRHMAIISTQEVCFSVRVSCCIFKRGRLEVEWCWKRRQIWHLLTPPPVKIRGAKGGRNLYINCWSYLRLNLRNTFDGHLLFGCRARWIDKT